jgi:hypothetical protein
MSFSLRYFERGLYIKRRRRRRSLLRVTLLSFLPATLGFKIQFIPQAYRYVTCRTQSESKSMGVKSDMKLI